MTILSAKYTDVVVVSRPLMVVEAVFVDAGKGEGVTS